MHILKSLLIVFLTTTLYAEYIATKDSTGIEPYYPTYFLPIVHNKNDINGYKRDEAEFQISFKKQIYGSIFADEIYSFGYTQKSMWQIYDASSPFRETNYQPEFMVTKPINWKNIDSLTFSINHQSNGQDIEKSRSWNRLILSVDLNFENRYYLNIKGWYRIPENKKDDLNDPNGDDNPDILNYIGYGELNIKIPFHNDEHLFNATTRLNTNTKKGSIEISYFYQVPWLKKSFLMINYFGGYGSSLIDYDKSMDRFGIGFSITR